MALPEAGSIPEDFTLPNRDGKTVSLKDYQGKNVLLWFFPRAFGGGCTREASGFRDLAHGFAAKNTLLLGITGSAPDELAAWADEVGFGAELLSDADKRVAIAYGAAESTEQERPSRVSVLIGPDGRVTKTYAVDDAEGHPAQVLADLGE